MGSVENLQATIVEETSRQKYVVLHRPGPTTTKLTFANHYDGVSVLEQSVTGDSILLR